MRKCTPRERLRVWRGTGWPRNRYRVKRLKHDTEAHALVKSVARIRGVPLYDILDTRRGLAAVCATRQLAMYLVHVLLARPQDEVGDLFGRGRTTVAHACRVIEDQREEATLEAEIAAIETLFAGVVADAGGEHADAA